MKFVVVVGSVNIDFAIRVAELPRPHETIMGGDLGISVGGKGLNQATACARLGLETHLVGAVGSDAFAEQALAHLKTRGVSAHHVHRLHGATGAASICVAQDGANMIVVAPGANARLTPQHVEQAEALIREAAAVIAQLETPLATVKAALEMARRHAVLILLNPAPVDARVMDLLPLADLVTPNEAELERLTGVTGQGDAALREALGRLIAAGAERAVVTLGRQGCATLIDGELVRVPAFTVEAVDAVGAGDVFNAALLSRILRGHSLPDAMRFAAAAAAISVTRPGADGAPSEDETATFLANFA
ncbi:MAG TPA: ribokinase [Asticcacaulis sp.]|nr:ribokinase [Asticcacaulis sp.]